MASRACYGLECIMPPPCETAPARSCSGWRLVSCVTAGISSTVAPKLAAIYAKFLGTVDVDTNKPA